MAEKIILFKEETIAKCRAKKEIRDQTKKKKSKYDDIILPDVIDNTTGYHSSCFKSYCSISFKKTDSNSSLSSQMSTGTEIDSNELNELNDATGEFDCENDTGSNGKLGLFQKIRANSYFDFDFIKVVNSKSKDCIFCNRRILTLRGKRHETTSKTQGSKRKEDIIRLLKVSNSTPKIRICEAAEYITYHKTCFAKMESKHMRNCDGIETHDECSSDTNTEENNSNLNWKNVRDINSIVFSQLSLYLGEKISEKREIVALRDIYNHYISLFTEEKCQSHRESTETSMQAHHLSEKILKSDTKIAKTLYKNRVFLHPQDMGLDEMLSKGFELEDDISTKIRKIGMEIRKSINQMNTKKMPQTNITLKNIIEGECEIPKELHLLIESIVESPRVQNNENSSYRAIRKNKILSICSSIILTASSGLIRPSMCLQLALAAKSLTGSRRMINILNRLGHCVSYTVTEGIETELAYTCSLENVILPFDLSPHSYTHVAFDNYDQYVETSSGKDTLHDTVGIAYQNCVEFGELSMNSLQQSINDIDNNRSRRRKYISILVECFWRFYNLIPIFATRGRYNRQKHSTRKRWRYLSP